MVTRLKFSLQYFISSAVVKQKCYFRELIAQVSMENVRRIKLFLTYLCLSTKNIHLNYVLCIFIGLCPEDDKKLCLNYRSKFWIRCFIVVEKCPVCIWCFGICLFDFDEKFLQNLPETITIFYLNFFFCSLMYPNRSTVQVL